ncbi:MAG TPA: thiamine pyrophosphate-binding protein [Candidatus Limnocylindria bacterium]|jgi:thiamine pyrophosphate-dependent acetolactate synthase large subunit-like protein|nr:thiamine pyrophosphate-binding protein [Candidatus Limnocylindria bacterium]
MTRSPRFGSDVIVDLLQAFGIEYVALNPGATYRGLHDSLVNYGGGKPEIILCTHEKVAVNVAHGYAKVTGRPMGAIVHDVVGLLHSTMGVYYAHLDRVPVMLLGATGPMDRRRRRPAIDWIHTAQVQGEAVRNFTKWDDQPATVADFPASFARAYRIATTEPAGPVYLCYDAGLQEDALARPVSIDDVVAAARPSPVQADPAALERAADLLARAERPVIVSEFTGRHPEAFTELVALAEELAAAVIDLNGRVNIPNRHPLNLTGGEALKDADVVLAVDVGDLHRALNELDRDSPDRAKRSRIPAGTPVVDIGLAELRQSKWAEDLGDFQPVALSIVADTRLALPVLRLLVRERAGSRDRGRRRKEVAAAHVAIQERWQREAREDWAASPMTAARLASELWAVIKDDDWVLTSNTLEEWALRLWDVDSPKRHPGRSFGTGTQIGVSLGVGLAYRGSETLIVDVQPDGDLLYDPGALWTAANSHIPLLVVMYNNRAYYNDFEHQIRVAQHRGTPVENARVGQEIDDPAPDFAALAKSFGWYAEGPITDPDAAGPAIARARKHVKETRMPALVDTIVRRRTPSRFR